MYWLLGFDGGGTNTRALLARADGTALALGTAGPANYQDVGRDHARHALEQAFLAAKAQLPGFCETEPLLTYYSLAGIVSEEDRMVIRELVAQSKPLARATTAGIHHDIAGALSGALSGRPGIVFIAGTGSSCFGCDAAGEEVRCGGWGQLLDDGGSGYWLGLQAMIVSTRAADGRGIKTELLETVLERLNLCSLDQIMHLLYHVGVSRSAIASLAPLVFAAADRGDAAACGILQQGANLLAELVEGAARSLRIDSPEVSYTGGVVENCGTYRNQIISAIRCRLPGAQVRPPELPPVAGAVLLAARAHRAQPFPSLIHNLRKFFPT